MQESEHKVAASITGETDFALTETILWEHCCGYWLLPEHLLRMKSSAAYFSRPFDEALLAEALGRIVEDLESAPHKVHVQIAANGEPRLSVEPLTETRAPVRAVLAEQSIDTDNDFLYHHTTDRRIYEQALADNPGVDEVLLWNSRGEVTESCSANIVVVVGEQRYTPPVSCGLLAGTYRASLLQEGSLLERVIKVDELTDCDMIYLINSLVGWREVELIHR